MPTAPKDNTSLCIELTQGYCTFVDLQDAELVSPYIWYAAVRPQGVYAATNKYIGKYKTTIILMHQLIMGFPGSQIDHIDTNGLNNRRKNLRVATNIQNSWNQRAHRVANRTSSYKGVSRQKRRTAWRARMRVNGEDIVLGYFAFEEEAAVAYDLGAIKYYGEYARLNFPRENYAAPE